MIVITAALQGHPERMRKVNHVANLATRWPTYISWEFGPQVAPLVLITNLPIRLRHLVNLNVHHPHHYL